MALVLNTVLILAATYFAATAEAKIEVSDIPYGTDINI